MRRPTGTETEAALCHQDDVPGRARAQGRSGAGAQREHRDCCTRTHTCPHPAHTCAHTRAECVNPPASPRDRHSRKGLSGKAPSAPVPSLRHSAVSSEANPMEGAEAARAPCDGNLSTHSTSGKDTALVAPALLSWRPHRAPTPLSPAAGLRGPGAFLVSRCWASWAAAGREMQGSVGLWTVSGHRTSLRNQPLFPEAEQCPESCQGTTGCSTAPGPGSLLHCLTRPAPSVIPRPCLLQREVALAAFVLQRSAALLRLHGALHRAAAPSCLPRGLSGSSCLQEGGDRRVHARMERVRCWGTG